MDHNPKASNTDASVGPNCPMCGHANAADARSCESCGEQFVKTTDESATPDCKLFRVRGVVLATFFGTILAGGIVLAINLRRINKVRQANSALVVCFLATICVLTVSYFTPEGAGFSLAISIVQMAVISKHTRTVMGSELDHHDRNNGQYSSSWFASLIGLLVLIGLSIVMAVVFLLTEPGLLLHVEGKFIDDRNGNIVYYEDSVHARDARFLSEELNNFGYFDDDIPTDVYLDHHENCFVVSYSLIDDAWEDDGVVDYYREMGEHLADTYFGHPLVVQLCNEDWDPQKTLRIENDAP